MHYWRIAYEAVYGKMSGNDIEVFRHSSKGYEIKEYNLDSEDDFRRWKNDVSPYHGFDVVYARVHLSQHIPMVNGIFMSAPVVIGILMIASGLS